MMMTARPTSPQDGAPGVVVGVRYDVWRPMMNTFGANWELSQLASPPLDIRITNVYGQQVVLKWVASGRRLAGLVTACCSSSSSQRAAACMPGQPAADAAAPALFRLM
jgi:hypothetical protein